MKFVIRITREHTIHASTLTQRPWPVWHVEYWEGLSDGSWHLCEDSAEFTLRGAIRNWHRFHCPWVPTERL